jgi:Uma2 family endonuclease
MAGVLTRGNEVGALDELLRPAQLADGTVPEQRIIVCGVSWSGYLEYDEKLGEDRAGPRLYFLDGDVEIMSTSDEHERIKTWIGDFLADFFLEAGLEVITRGQATMRDALKKAGAEPGESWCIGEAKKYPDLVFEVALTTGINKLEIYRRMNVPEVWFWARKKVEIHALNRSGQYERVEKSRLLPKLDIRLIERCVGMDSWREARKAFRASLATRN